MRLGLAVLVLLGLAIVATIAWTWGDPALDVRPTGAASETGPAIAAPPKGLVTGPDASEVASASRSDPERQNVEPGDIAPPGEVPRGELAVTVTVADAPAPGVPVVIHACAGEPLVSSRQRAATNGEGRARFPELLVGAWAVLVAGVERRAIVRPGAATELTIAIPVGDRARVRVVDDAGVPVPAVPVYLWPAGRMLDVPHHEPGTLVGVTDATGELRLTGLPSVHAHRSWVMAASVAYGNSLARMVPKPRGDESRENGSAEAAATAAPIVELTVDRLGTTVVVAVIDQERQGIAGADILVRPLEPPGSRRIGPTRATPFTTWRKTGAGRASFARLAAGRYTAHVRAPGFGARQVEFSVGEEARQVVEVQLGVAGEVRGVVRNDSGSPIAEATVRLRMLRERLQAVTAADGRFAFPGLPAGRAEWSARRDGHGAAAGGVDVRAGAVAELAIELPALVMQRGIVVDERQQPLAGVRLEATHDLPGFRVDRQRGETDAEGRFALGLQPRRPYALTLFEPDRHQPIRLPDLSAVRAAARELTIVLPDERRASAFVTLRLVDGDRRPALRDVSISVSGENRELHGGSTLPIAERDDATGDLRLGPLLSGDYRIEFTRPDRLRFERAVPGLLPGSTRDLGDVAWPVAGAIAIDVERLPGVPAGEVLAEISRNGQTMGLRLDAAGRGEMPVLPGTWRVTVYGTGFRWPATTIVVTAGETARRSFVLRPAVRVPIRVFAVADDAPLVGRMLAADGSEVLDFELEPGQEHDDWMPWLDVGRFRFTAAGASGARYTAELVVDSLDPATERRAIRWQRAR